MSTKKQDRAYQTEIEDAIFEHLFEGQGNCIAAAPGGTGKSFVMAKLIKKLVIKWPGTRVMQLAQDSKLLNQNCAELLGLWPEAPVGIYSAGLKQRDTREPIIFAGIQSCAKRATEFGKIHIVIVDECDQISHKDETLYQKFIKALKDVNPNLRVIGLTATPYRLGMGCLTNLPLWDKVVIDLTKTERFNEFITRGFLSPLVTKRACREMDITNLSMKGGEFDEKEMQELADTDELNKAVVEECIRYGQDRKHWLVFSSGVKHGHRLAKLFNSKGVTAVMLSGEDTMKHREEQETLFREGKVRCLVNCGLYGRGWNMVGIDLIAWARATQSVALWVQGTVRGTRRAPGKANCLVLDFAGNTRRLGPINDPVVPAPRRKGDAVKGEAPVKVCPECCSYLHTRVMVCPDCGYQFPPPKTITKKAATDEILKNVKKEPQIEEFYIRSIRYKAKVGKSGNPYLEVTYGVLTERFREFLFVENDNQWVRNQFGKWWFYRGGESPVPSTTQEALDRAHTELKIPTLIRVDVNQKWPKVVGCEFEDDPKISDGETTISIDKPYCESQPDDDIDLPF